MAETIVLPGDEVGVAEEYEPGAGTYESGGRIVAATVGLLDLDETNKVARVKPFNPPAQLEPGDIVYAVVNNTRASMATADIVALHGRDRQVAGRAEGTLHISRVSEDYTEDFGGSMRIGDTIRAKVVQVKPSLQIITAEPTLGVVLALCTRCRGVLDRKEGSSDLYCGRCERSEPRKIAQDYGELALDVPAAALGGGKVPEPRRREGRGPPRGGDRRRGGGRGPGRRGGPGRGGRPRDGGRRRRDSRRR